MRAKLTPTGKLQSRVDFCRRPPPNQQTPEEGNFTRIDCNPFIGDKNSHCKECSDWCNGKISIFAWLDFPGTFCSIELVFVDSSLTTKVFHLFVQSFVCASCYGMNTVFTSGNTRDAIHLPFTDGPVLESAILLLFVIFLQTHLSLLHRSFVQAHAANTHLDSINPS